MSPAGIGADIANRLVIALTREKVCVCGEQQIKFQVTLSINDFNGSTIQPTAHCFHFTFN